MSGAPCGLDWRAALASMPAGLDADFVNRLLTVAEVEFLLGYAETIKK